ncbi:MAG: hypothetical protein ACREOG_10525 [Gemmatimonadaceae bacterium]
MSDTLRSMLIEPPYAAARRNTGEAPPPALGSILLIDCLDVRPTSAQLKPIVDSAPWCPVCVLAVDRWEVRHIRRTSRVTVMFTLDDGAGGTRGILSAVSSRPRPTPPDVAEWIVARTRLPSLRRTLVDLFTRPLMTRAEALRLPWSVREQLALLGEWEACDWQLMWHVAEAASRGDVRASVVPDLDVRSDELLGVDAAAREQLAGWEWIPETALRCAGFFSSDRMGARRELGCVAVLDALALRSLAGASWRRRAESEVTGRAGASVREFARAG